MRQLLATTLALLIFYIHPVHSQNREIDSLRALAKNSDGTLRIDRYLAAANASKNIQADTSLSLATQALTLSRLHNYMVGEITGNIMIGRALATKGSYILAQEYYSTAEALARNAGNDSLTARALMGAGSCNWQLGKHAEAIEKHFAAIRISEKNGMVTDIANAKVLIAMVYQSQEKVPLAERYVHEALAVLRDKAVPTQQLNALHTLANIYGMQGKISEAMEIDKEGLRLSEESNNQFFKSMFYDNMANCYLFGDPPDYARSLGYFRLSLAIDSSFGNAKQMSDSYKNMGTVFMTQQKYQEAVPYLIRSNELAHTAGFLQGEQQGTEMLSAIYKLSGNDALAYETLKKSTRLKDSLVTAAREARIAEMQTFYETEQQKQTIELQETQLSRKNYILIGTIVTALLAGLLGYSMYRRFKLKQQARMQLEIMNQQELATRAVIEAEEKERQRIARDLHDGVGQMMSAARINLSAFEAEKTFENMGQQIAFNKIVGLVDESCREIREVSHNMVPNALLKHSLAAAVSDFLDKINQKSIRIHLFTEGLDKRLDSNVETVLYRVVQECVNNVIKHASASSLDISIVRDKDGISATIEDNGTGFDTSLKNDFTGIGLKNIQARIGYLKGSFDLNSAPGRGTLIGLYVPLASAFETVTR
ncbi:MAG: sensor histidine kinase [Chitinophagaceae bacterium]